MKNLRDAYRMLSFVRPQLNTRERQEAYGDFIRQTRGDIRRMERDDRLHSLRASWRNPEWKIYYSDDSEYWSEAVILPDDGVTDDETVNEFVRDIEVTINSSYDCTGKPYTCWVHWSRQPAGIVIVHRLGLDV